MWTLIDPNQADDIEADLSAVPHRRSSLWHIIGYAAASLLLTAVLLAQVSYRHLDSISQHDTLRPWLLSACELANCVLPTRQDSRLIVSEQLAIDPHPAFRDISQLMMTFTNTAGFPQPLPTIELVFSDIRGQAVAGRRFHPRQYLTRSPSAPAVPTMSAQQSLNAQLAFVTPADAAVNYQVRFVYE